jgi:hypothetical protein
MTDKTPTNADGIRTLSGTGLRTDETGRLPASESDRSDQRDTHLPASESEDLDSSETGERIIERALTRLPPG